MSNFVPEKTALGIEFGSTRIKAVLIGPEHTPLAQGDYTWENQLHNGIWTYPLEQVWQGLQSAYAALAADVQQKYGCTLTKVGCIGTSPRQSNTVGKERWKFSFNTTRGGSRWSFSSNSATAISPRFSAILNASQNSQRLPLSTPYSRGGAYPVPGV